MKVGELQLVTCHKIPSRSFFFRGRQFPVCARCTGIYLGFLSFPLFTFNVIQLDLMPSLNLLIPTLADGFTQAYFKRESNNLLRLVTGILAGIGQMSLVAIIGKSIGYFILNHFF